MVVLLGNQSVEFLTLLFWKSFLFLISLDLLTHYRIDVSVILVASILSQFVICLFTSLGVYCFGMVFRNKIVWIKKM